MLTSKNRASLYGAFPQNGQGRSQTKKTKEIARKINTYIYISKQNSGKRRRKSKKKVKTKET